MSLMADATLDLIAALGQPDREVERAGNVRQGFLRDARKGKCRDPRSGPAWARIREWLRTQPVGKGLDPTLAAKAAGPVVERDGVAVPAGIAAKFLAVKSAADLMALGQSIAAETARDGGIDPRLSDTLQSWSQELRQVIKLREDERAREQIVELVPMTLDQVAAFDAWRKTQTTRPLAPGEGAASPTKKTS